MCTRPTSTSSSSTGRISRPASRVPMVALRRACWASRACSPRSSSSCSKRRRSTDLQELSVCTCFVWAMDSAASADQYHQTAERRNQTKHGSLRLITGGLVTRYVGWEYIFFLNIPIGATALLLARRIVPESRLVGARRRFDPLGAFTVTGALLLLVYAISNAPQVGWSTTRTIALLAASAMLLAAFLVVETRVEAPLMPLRIFRLRTVAAANAVGLLLGGSFFAFIFIGTLYMQQVLGYSALQTGVAWLAASLTSLALAGLSQKLVTRISPGPVMALGVAGVGGALPWGGLGPVHGHFWGSLAGPFFVAGAGGAFSFIPISLGGLTGVAEREAGLASGLLNTSQQLGGAIGVAVGSTVA